jgi:hypothetical protein
MTLPLSLAVLLHSNRKDTRFCETVFVLFWEAVLSSCLSICRKGSRTNSKVERFQENSLPKNVLGHWTNIFGAALGDPKGFKEKYDKIHTNKQTKH